MDGIRFLERQRGFHILNRTEGQSNGFLKGNPNRPPVDPHPKNFHSSDIAEATRTGKVFQ
jgi:hypothetical protein